MSQIPSEEHAAGTVIEVFQKGWMLKERLVRPAMVVAAEPPAPQASEAAEAAREAQPNSRSRRYRFERNRIGLL